MKFFDMTMWDLSRIIGQFIKVWWVCAFFVFINVFAVARIVKESRDKT